MPFKNFRQLLIAVLVLQFTGQRIQTAPLKSSETEFIVLHNNDMHARFEQIGIYGNKCSPADAVANKCYGGFARTAHEIRKFREEAKQPGGIPVLYLNAGDTYSGTPWFYAYKDNITSEFMNVLQPDAISLGNHEFDDGISGLVPFLNHVNFPVLVANLDFKKSPALAATKSLKASTIFEIHGTKIGVIGYLTPDTKELSLANGLELIPEVEAINKEADLLQQQGVTIIIALGHSGFKTDQAIAMHCPLVDLVIGGHSHTFLYTGTEPDIDKATAAYPTVVRQANGKEVPVVQAYAYTKYLGYIKLKFDAEGNLQFWDGLPILLNAVIPQDSDILKLLDRYRPGIEAEEKKIVGHTKVTLDGQMKHCREKECNLGNMIADSMVFARTKEYALLNDEFWSDTAIAFVQGGGIRSTIVKQDDGTITQNDLIEVLPFNNNLMLVEVLGKTIRSMLEHSASKLGSGFGGFLQMSGVHVIYDASASSGFRVKSVRVLCAECNIPRYNDLDDLKPYKMIVSNFILNGGDGFSIPTLSTPQKLKLNDIDAAADYIRAKSPVYPAVEWRIKIEGEVPQPTMAPSPDSSTTTGGGGHILASGFLILVSLLLNYLR